jgi:endoglucanase
VRFISRAAWHCIAPVVLWVVLPASAPGDSGVWIRVNQIGYLPDDPKIALLSSAQPLAGRFEVGAYTAEIGPDAGAWGPFQHNYRLDFSALRTPGRYVLKYGDITSLPFSIGADAYQEVPAKLIEFMRLQRCGDNPVSGRKCHQQDAIDTVTGERVDLVGGWHDAGDRLKHMITTSYCVAALFLAGAEEEARYGAALLAKIHPNADTIYVQIGDDRDHLPPETLWHDDQSDYGWGPGGPRAAWPATGEPQGPKYKNKSTGLANLAGRTAAALVLAGDFEKAQSAYRLAQAHPGCAMSVPVRAPYYPYVNLAHWRLYPHVDAETRAKLAGYYRAGLERVRQLAEQNPYRLGTPLVWCSTNDAVAFATQAVLYERMTGDRQFRALAAEARDWIFGRNPWGVSFVLGVPAGGDAASQPHHLFWKLKRHLPVGGLVDGPVYKDINDGLKFADFGDDRLARFQSDVGVYHDVFVDFSTNEPIIDGTVSLLLLLHVWEMP